MKKPLAIEHVAISKLIASTYNPRKWSKESLNQLKESIKRFDNIVPLVVNNAPNRNMIVINGHMRISAMKELGHTTAPVVFVTISDETKEKELNLRLNRNTGEFDYDLLSEYFDADLLSESGFDDIEISDIFSDALVVTDDNFDVKKELSKIKVPTAKIGDMYQLGPHRLACCDSLKQENIKRLVGSRQIDFVYVDPIYNIGLDYNAGVGGKGQYGGTVNDSKTTEGYKEFLKTLIANSLSVAKTDSHFFFWSDQTYIGLLQELYVALGIKNKRVCLWIKGRFNPTPSVAFNKAYESCVYGVRGKPFISPSFPNFNEILNQEFGSGDGVIDEILDLWLTKRLSGQGYRHATQKPVTLHEKPLKRCTKPGDTVLDICAGSGSTLIAAHSMNRVCFAAEIEPVFIDLIIKRWEHLTGEKAKLIN